MSLWKNLLLNPSLRLENSRVLLTPVSMDHLDDLAKIGTHPEIWRHNPFFFCDSKAKIQENIQFALNEKENFSRVALVLFDKKSKSIAGTSSFYAISEQHKKIAIGYTWLGMDFQKTGLNSALKSAQYQFAFDVLRCVRVEFHTDFKNEKSKRSILSHGCTLEGVFRNHIIKHDGNPRDTANFSILANEYYQNKAKLHVE